MTLTKAHIAESIQQRLGYTKNQSVDLVEQLLEIVKGTLANAEDVLVSRIGRSCVHDKKARRGRNPATGDSMISMTCSTKSLL
jgi:integration host factor subunit alpha